MNLYEICPKCNSKNVWFYKENICGKLFLCCNCGKLFYVNIPPNIWKEKDDKIEELAKRMADISLRKIKKIK